MGKSENYAGRHYIDERKIKVSITPQQKDVTEKLTILVIKEKIKTQPSLHKPCVVIGIGHCN